MTVLPEIRAAALGGTVERRDYHRLFEALMQAENPRDPEWLQGWILLHCAARKKAYRTQRYLSRYNRISRRKGRTAEYEAFVRLLFDELGLQMPIGSRYSETFRSADVAAVLAGCAGVVGRLAEQGLQVFADSGTLLGLVREGTLLRHDNDIDLAVVLEARGAAAAAREWIALSDRLIAAGLALHRSEWSKVTLKLPGIGAFGVDLFPAWAGADDRMYLYPHTCGDLRRAQILPLGVHAGTGLPIPRDPEAVLVSNYGEGWRIPDQGWTFDWIRANRRFAEFLAEMAQAGQERPEPTR